MRKITIISTVCIILLTKSTTCHSQELNASLFIDIFKELSSDSSKIQIYGSDFFAAPEHQDSLTTYKILIEHTIIDEVLNYSRKRNQTLYKRLDKILYYIPSSDTVNIVPLISEETKYLSSGTKHKE